MNANERELIFKEEVFRIVGAAMEVSNVLGPGFLEAVYQEAMERELAERNIPFTPQQRIVISYKGQPLAKEYIADLVCFGQIIVEIKALKTLTTLEEAQLLNYLKAAGLPLGLLLNFGGPQLKWARFANTRSIRGPSRSFADESPGAR